MISCIELKFFSADSAAALIANTISNSGTTGLAERTKLKDSASYGCKKIPRSYNQLISFGCNRFGFSLTTK